MIADAETILRVCGVDSYLHIGCGQSSLVFELLKRSIDAYGIDNSSDLISFFSRRIPERFFQGSINNFPLKNNEFGTIVVGEELFSFSDEDLINIFIGLRSIIKHNLVLYFPRINNRNMIRHELKSRLFWEKLAILTEYRRHPRGLLATPYSELEDESLGTLIFFEKIPDKVRESYPLTWLLKNRDLHMDMLREAGRRSDAHVSRYALAATKVRPGDVVLDAACGLGYGTAVLAACSPGSRFIGVDIDPDSIAYATQSYANNPSISYKTCDVNNLSFLKDHSVDTVVSFETIEHVKDYDKFLNEVSRVLKPDGRFIGSVPNQWCDETGNDPNPHHFHVFDWEKLKQAVEKYFIVDERWVQNAGGGYKVVDGKRELYSLPFNQELPKDIEWWLISACGNPLKSKQVSYENPFDKTNNNIPVHVDFEKYYDNPWIYRVIVQLGERISDRSVLISFCSQVIEQSKLGSADQGAALCVICYQLLESGQVNLKDTMALIDGINAYDQAYDRANPHAYRWAVSLHYVAARLLLALGKRQDAKATFIACAEMDPVLFSPLLATKTISARMYAGLLYLSEGDVENAKNQLRLGIKESHRVLQGNWETILGGIDAPLPFGLQEAAELLDIASQCSQMLHAIEREGSVPGFIWEKINLKRFGLVEWNKSLERENRNLRLLV